MPDAHDFSAELPLFFSSPFEMQSRRMPLKVTLRLNGSVEFPEWHLVGKQSLYSWQYFKLHPWISWISWLLGIQWQDDPCRQHVQEGQIGNLSLQTSQHSGVFPTFVHKQFQVIIFEFLRRKNVSPKRSKTSTCHSVVNRIFEISKNNVIK